MVRGRRRRRRGRKVRKSENFRENGSDTEGKRVKEGVKGKIEKEKL